MRNCATFYMYYWIGVLKVLVAIKNILKKKLDNFKGSFNIQSAQNVWCVARHVKNKKILKS